MSLYQFPELLIRMTGHNDLHEFLIGCYLLQCLLGEELGRTKYQYNT